MLISTIVVMLSIWNHNNFDNYMVTRLFKFERNERPIEAGAIRNLKEYAKSWMPNCCQRFKCCQPSKLDRTFISGRKKLAKEANIMGIVK